MCSASRSQDFVEFEGLEDLLVHVRVDDTGLLGAPCSGGLDWLRAYRLPPPSGHGDGVSPRAGRPPRGVTHEGDYPPEAASKLRVTRTAVDPQRDSKQIHKQVEALLHDHRSIYDLDIDGIRALRPDLILTQEICEVCAVSREQVQAMADQLYGSPNVVSLEPSTSEGVLQNIAYLGEVTGRPQLAAEQAIACVHGSRLFARRPAMRTRRRLCASMAGAADDRRSLGAENDCAGRRRRPARSGTGSRRGAPTGKRSGRRGLTSS